MLSRRYTPAGCYASLLITLRYRIKGYRAEGLEGKSQPRLWHQNPRHPVRSDPFLYTDGGNYPGSACTVSFSKSRARPPSLLGNLPHLNGADRCSE